MWATSHQDCSFALEAAGHLSGPQPAHAGVVGGVAPDREAGLGRPPGLGGVAADVVADAEEAGPGQVVGEDVEDPGPGRAVVAVVEGQRHPAGRAGDGAQDVVRHLAVDAHHPHEAVAPVAHVVGGRGPQAVEARVTARPWCVRGVPMARWRWRGLDEQGAAGRRGPSVGIGGLEGHVDAVGLAHRPVAQRDGAGREQRGGGHRHPREPWCGGSTTRFSLVVAVLPARSVAVATTLTRPSATAW